MSLLFSWDSINKTQQQGNQKIEAIFMLWNLFEKFETAILTEFAITHEIY